MYGLKTIKSLMIAGTLSALGTMSYAQNVELSYVPSGNLMDKLDKQALPAALEYLIESGVSLTYLGDAGGIAGYLGESPTGKIQTFYITPDGNHVIAGVLFRSGGVNVTGVQINEMKDRFENAKMRAESISEDMSSVTPNNVPAPVPTITQNLTEITPPQIQAGEAEQLTQKSFLSKRDVEEVTADLDKLAWFSVGAPSAPEIYMLVDPNCKFCHKAWQQLRPRVIAGEMSVRIIMIGALKGSTTKAISILSRDEPGRAWFAGEGSVAQTPVAEAPKKGSEKYNIAKKYLKTNEDFAVKHELGNTPYFFAFDKAGNLYENAGWPKDERVFFSIIERNE